MARGAAGAGVAARSLPPMVSLWSWHDSMVAPQTSSRLADGDNIELAGVGHNALLGDPEVLARVAEQIRLARAGGAGRGEGPMTPVIDLLPPHRKDLAGGW